MQSSSAAGGVVQLRRDCWFLQGCEDRIILRGDATANAISLSFGNGYYWFAADSLITLPTPPQFLSYNDCHYYSDDHTRARCPATALREVYVTLGEGNDQLTGDLGPHLFYANAEAGDDSMQIFDPPDPSLTAPHSRVLHGGEGNDRLSGDDNLGHVYGDAGHDVLVGGGGADYLAGGSGSDTVSYAGRTTPVHVTIGDCCDFNDGGVEDQTGTSRDRVAAGVENLVGGSANDTLIGDAASNSFDGGPGADDMWGGAGAEDTASYATRTAPVRVIIDDQANDGWPGPGGEQDNVHTDIENLMGGAGNDTLSGSTGANRLVGGSGGDYIFAGGGPDLLFGGQGVDNMFGGAGDDVLEGGADSDSLIAGPGSDAVRGGEGPDILYPGRGMDLVIDGGPGIDTASYHSGEPWYPVGMPVAVSLDGIANDGADLDGDRVGEESDNVWRTVEHLSGGSEADTLVGSDGVNAIIGMEGADRIIGRGGNDILNSSEPSWSAGNDVLIGGAGNDGLYGGAGNDILCARDGAADVVDGGPNTATGSDKAQADGGGLDQVAGIEQTLGPKAACP